MRKPHANGPLECAVAGRDTPCFSLRCWRRRRGAAAPSLRGLRRRLALARCCHPVPEGKRNGGTSLLFLYWRRGVEGFVLGRLKTRLRLWPLVVRPSAHTHTSLSLPRVGLHAAPTYIVLCAVFCATIEEQLHCSCVPFATARNQ